MDIHALKDTVTELLRGGSAHLAAEKVLADVSPGLRHVRPGPEGRSVWEELEHLRIAQEDILRYTFDPDWTSPPWPEGYWPDPEIGPDDETFVASIRAFLADRDELIERLADEALDPTAEIPHGEGRTYLRQFLLAADHNAWHLGRIVLARKLLGDWH